MQRIDVKEDFKNLGQMPCARTALLSGIAGGTGIGAVRFLASHRMSNLPYQSFKLRHGSKSRSLDSATMKLCHGCLNKDRTCKDEGLGRRRQS